MFSTRNYLVDARVGTGAQPDGTGWCPWGLLRMLTSSPAQWLCPSLVQVTEAGACPVGEHSSAASLARLLAPCPSPAEDMQVCQGRGQPHLERNEEVHGLPTSSDGLAKVSGQLQTRPLCGHREQLGGARRPGRGCRAAAGAPPLPLPSPGPKGPTAPTATEPHTATQAWTRVGEGLIHGPTASLSQARMLTIEAFLSAAPAALSLSTLSSSSSTIHSLLVTD